MQGHRIGLTTVKLAHILMSFLSHVNFFRAVSSICNVRVPTHINWDCLNFEIIIHFATSLGVVFQFSEKHWA